MRRSERRGHRPVAALAGAALCAVLVAGCGIRTTSVPVDAGAAPSRVPCALHAEDVAAEAERGAPVQIYLVCASQLVTVDRAVQVEAAKSDRLQVATELLTELRRRPTAYEQQAGFSTDVPKALRVYGPGAGDAKEALRLSQQPEDLPAEALAQIVCTFAENEELAPGETVTLGGPGKYPARGYLCTAETKASPKAVPTLGSVGLP
ncbi:hypothetical protein P8A18_21765 [Streptomyces castrisilvae]|uniref:Lipoprotein n=1 Tax=Streptomyces castrisilvae TaxID=3033811 RepID=A0ABY9HMW1_9ACTN|nr:hypothetical protein [Streptomyces sp. Mut1]WLQ35888.1 hypothetical protein P8A18_21765 [Streptomyces sp. Mut1]